MVRLDAACLKSIPNDIKEVRLVLAGHRVVVETERGQFMVENGMVMCPQKNGSIFR